MFRRLLLLFGLAIAALAAAAKSPLPLRVVSFDPTIRKVDQLDAQQITLALVEGRKAGKTYTVHLAPSQKTAGFIGQVVYLRVPLERLTRKDVRYFAGELLDVAPAFVPPDFGTVSIPFKEGAAERYIAGRIALDGVNEINGVFEPPTDPAQWMPAGEAIATATKAHPNGVQGNFVFRVMNSALVADTVWLNSDPDYRSPQSLNVAIPPHVAADFKLRYKADIGKYLKGRKVVISGIVERVKIETINPKGFYYQTQLPLWSAHQIRIVE